MVPEDVPEDGEHAQEPEHLTVADAGVSCVRRPIGTTASELFLGMFLWFEGHLARRARRRRRGAGFDTLGRGALQRCTRHRVDDANRGRDEQLVDPPSTGWACATLNAGIPPAVCGFDAHDANPRTETVDSTQSAHWYHGETMNLRDSSGKERGTEKHS